MTSTATSPANPSSASAEKLTIGDLEQLAIAHGVALDLDANNQIVVPADLARTVGPELANLLRLNRTTLGIMLAARRDAKLDAMALFHSRSRADLRKHRKAAIEHRDLAQALADLEAKHP